MKKVYPAKQFARVTLVVMMMILVCPAFRHRQIEWMKHGRLR